MHEPRGTKNREERGRKWGQVEEEGGGESIDQNDNSYNEVKEPRMVNNGRDRTVELATIGIIPRRKR